VYDTALRYGAPAEHGWRVGLSTFVIQCVGEICG
jgi:hypothetical protein